jgi:hypothetical protein
MLPKTAMPTGRQDGGHPVRERLAPFLRGDDLTPIHVHAEASEVSRAGGIPGKTSWTQKRLEWIRSQLFEQEAHTACCLSTCARSRRPERPVERLQWHVRRVLTEEALSAATAGAISTYAATEIARQIPADRSGRLQKSMRCQCTSPLEAASARVRYS